MLRTTYLLTGLLVTAAVALGCAGTHLSPSANCQTAITGHSSPAPGTLTLDGQFYADETVLLKYNTANGQTKQLSGTPMTQRNQFTFTGLPSGTVAVDVIISCASGQDDRGVRTYDIQ